MQYQNAMDIALPSIINASSTLLPTGSLLKSLIHISHELDSMENFPFLQNRNISTMRRKIKLLSFLFEDIQEATITQLPPSSVLCLTELFSVMRKVQCLIQSCKNGSSLWGLQQTEFISNQFYILTNEMGKALDILPLSLLKIKTDVKEQIELLHKQAKQAELFADPRDLQRKEELFQVLNENNEKNGKVNGFNIDIDKVKDIFCSIGLRSLLDYEEEISKLRAEAVKQAGTGGLTVISNINNLTSFVLYFKSLIFGDEENGKNGKDFKKQLEISLSKKFDYSSSSKSLNPIPDEFRCPISLELMSDPVIVASGHTYDLNSIAEWINSGHHTCPKSGQRLIHTALVPNYALRSLIQQWCQENNIPLRKSTESSISGSRKTNSERKLTENVIDHISASKAANDAVKMTAEFLVGKLATGSPEIQRQASYELRLLAKTGTDNRRIIAEAGAIPFLVTLLNANDPRIQENAITATLNLSIFNNNKILIVEAGALDNIVQVLESGKTMEARENAAAAIFSLSMLDDFKAYIGKHPRAILGLVRLLREGTSAGKRDAALALFNLALYKANKESIVHAGAIQLLADLLMDDKAGITDDALQVLLVVSGCSEGVEELRKSRVLVPLLVDLLRFGSPSGKENAISLLLMICRDGEEVARRLLMNPRSIPSLQSLATDGSLKARRKADALLRLLNKCCSIPQSC